MDQVICTRATETLPAYSIPREEVLPIVEDKTPIGTGQFAKVYRSRISCEGSQGLQFQSKGITRFVRKVFAPEDKGFGETEWFNLVQCRKLEHEHLMPALAAFTHGDQFSIMFQEAECTLKDVLNATGPSYTSDELWNQVHGLAAGLARLHTNDQGIIAYHRDLNPANILVVNKVMKIGDFGQLKFRRLGDSQLNDVPSSNVTRTYSPPYLNGVYESTMDVWSLGAMVSEVATFDLQKSDGVQRYRQERRDDRVEGRRNLITTAFHLRGQLRKSVSAKHSELQELVAQSRAGRISSGRASPFQQLFFADTFFALLGDMLWENGDRRCPTASTVADQLKLFYDRARNPQLYTTSRPSGIYRMERLTGYGSAAQDLSWVT